MSLNIKQGDTVVVRTGSSKSKQGKVLRVEIANGSILIEGVNLKKRRQCPRKAGSKGQIIEKPAPLNYSNVLIWCASCKQGVRIKAKMSGTTKTRICAKCGKTI
ncbi:MAG: 50S ribosomal protein L24 [Candidatus Vogelbacteria bacterium]|nr:50S ribosomal protein L24 [Candidatus Vogelbacteria bacterium]